MRCRSSSANGRESHAIIAPGVRPTLCNNRARHEPTAVEAVTPRAEPSAALSPVQWVICAIAAIGFAFDTYELLMLPLIVRPALMDLITANPDSAEFSR